MVIRKTMKKPLDLDCRNIGLPYWTRVNFVIYWTWAGKILELPYYTGIDFMIYWS